MTTILLVSGIYLVGCLLTMMFFMLGRAPALEKGNWPWPVIFLWPLLLLWPIHALAGSFINRKTRKQK